jgi:hypothetical protein
VFFILEQLQQWSSRLCPHDLNLFFCSGMSKTLSVGGDGGYKMNIFTVNIPTFHARYRRYVLITNEFHEFC